MSDPTPDLCDDCGNRPATVAVTAIAARNESTLIQLDPPTRVCLGCYHRMWRQARAQANRLERPTIGNSPVVSAQLEVAEVL